MLNEQHLKPKMVSIDCYADFSAAERECPHNQGHPKSFQKGREDRTKVEARQISRFKVQLCDHTNGGLVSG